jgi:hypothetical protein
VQTQDASPATLGGYRLVRSLGAGARADVVLGAGTTGTVALKVLRPEVPEEDVGRELEALGRVPQDHCARLVDVLSTSEHHPVLAFERVHRGSVAHWLADRDGIAPGEAVTLLAPLASTLTRLHLAGVAHTNLTPTNIHLGVAGEPVILGFGHAVLFDAGLSIAAIDARAEARSDRTALAAIARRVLGAALPQGDAEGVERFDEWLRSASLNPTFEFAAELEARLFDFASPRPLEFSRRRPGEVSGRGHDPQPSALFEPVVGKQASSVASVTRSGTSASVLGGWLGALLDASPAQIARRMALPAIRSVRRPVWIVAGAVAVALVSALVLVPQGPGAQRARADAPLKQTAAQEEMKAIPETKESEASRTGNPVVALGGLLAIRGECFSARSVRCLAGVDDEASGALDVDSTVIQRMQRGAQTPRGSVVSAPAPRVVEQLGDSALVRLDARGSGPNAKPASVLLIRTKAGWRIRSYLSGKQAKSG